ncbi:MAG: hypothetical protein LBL13_07430 [Bacteroidales bacterium]|jgi:hypothetical protein|nr:hypothetical protein [Bacteroidales bacterium]
MNALTGNKAVLLSFRSIDMNALTGNAQNYTKYNWGERKIGNKQASHEEKGGNIGERTKAQKEDSNKVQGQNSERINH